MRVGRIDTTIIINVRDWNVAQTSSCTEEFRSQSPPYVCSELIGVRVVAFWLDKSRMCRPVMLKNLGSRLTIGLPCLIVTRVLGRILTRVLGRILTGVLGRVLGKILTGVLVRA